MQGFSSPPKPKERQIKKKKAPTYPAFWARGPRGPAARRASRKPAVETTNGHASRLPNPVLKVVETSLDADKAEEIVTIDLTNKTSIADYTVIPTARSHRQLPPLPHHPAIHLKPPPHS